MAVSQSRLIITASAIAMMCSTLAIADPYGPHGHRDHRYHEYPHWREGHWYHGGHDGRLGWWWVTAGLWSFYPAPIYPYPNPYIPPAIVEAPQPAPVTSVPPPAPVWYYCQSSHNYYPYASVCPEGWQAVPAQPSDAPAHPSGVDENAQ